MKTLLLALLVSTSFLSLAQAEDLLCLGVKDDPYGGPLAVLISEPTGPTDLQQAYCQNFILYNFLAPMPETFKQDEWREEESFKPMYQETNKVIGTQSVKTIHLNGGCSGNLDFELTETSPGKFSGVIKGNRMNLPEEGVSVNCHYYKWSD